MHLWPGSTSSCDLAHGGNGGARLRSGGSRGRPEGEDSAPTGLSFSGRSFVQKGWRGESPLAENCDGYQDYLAKRVCIQRPAQLGLMLAGTNVEAVHVQ